MKGDKILCLIDDDDVYQYTFITQIQENKAVKEVLQFYDGEMAIDFFENKAEDSSSLPDIIFLDINMPIMDGWEFLEEFIKIKPNIGKQIVIYVVSSSIDPKDIHRANSLSEISDYLIKPIVAEQLNRIVTNA